MAIGYKLNISGHSLGLNPTFLAFTPLSSAFQHSLLLPALKLLKQKWKINAAHMKRVGHSKTGSKENSVHSILAKLAVKKTVRKFSP